MLPTFVIGLREGLEAALIVGIIAAFLRKQGRKDLVRWVLVGVSAAALLCLGIGIALNVVSKDLPQRQQEGMETVIGVVAVGMVTYMVVWMRRHSRELKGQLEGMASDAMGGSSRAGRAMVVMAFLAVLREGIETVVFLLAVFNFNKNSGTSTGAAGPAGVILGLALAILLGYGIYRGGVRLNLSKFFRATGLVLVLVAAGLVVNALHTAHEAGWLNAGQSQTIDLTWLVRPGSVQSSLLTGMLGVQPKPVLIETIGWLAYLIPVGLYVAWPPGKGLARRATSRVLLVGGVGVAVVAAILAVVAPSRPGTAPAAAAVGTTTVSASGNAVVARTGATSTPLTRTDVVLRDGVALGVFTAHSSVDEPTLRTASFAQVAALNGGALPIGTRTTGVGQASLRYTDVVDYTAYVEPRTDRVVQVSVAHKVLASLVSDGRVLPLDNAVSDSSQSTPTAVASAAARAARHDHDAFDHRSVLIGFAWFTGVVALMLLLAGGALTLRPRSKVVPVITPAGTLVNS